MASEKTRGQRLYEHVSPPQLFVVEFERRHFATEADGFHVPNESHIGWQYLSKECQESWERLAPGHHIFSGEEAT